MNKALALNAIILLGALIAACVAHSVPTSAPRNTVAEVPAANDEPSSNPSDGAAEKNTTAQDATPDVVSSTDKPFVVLPDPRGPDVAPPFVVLPDPSKPLTIAERMPSLSNAVSKRYGIIRDHSPELTAAAQDHADHLARQGYGVYVDRYGRQIPQPSGHDEWGDGNAHTRALAHGVNFSIDCDDPRSSIPGHNVTGEIIYCGKVPPEKAFASWEQHDSGHWIPLTSREFDLAGFGYAENASGQGIFVGMFGNSKVAAAAPPVSQPVRAAPQIPRRQISQQPYLILPPVDRHPPPLLHSTQTYSSCGPQGCPPRIFRRGRQ